MQRSKFQQAISEALVNEYENSIPTYEEHRFSPQFQKKMKKLINRRKKPYYKIINTFGKRVACILLIIFIASSVTIMSVGALRKAFVGFWVSVLEEFSIIQSADIDNAPETIEDVYEITYDLSDYKYNLWFSDSTSRYTEYANGDIVIYFNQDVKSIYDRSYNTEDIKIEKITIKGHEAMCFCDNHNYITVIWDNGDYIISLGSDLGKNALIEIAESVQKAEP